MVAHEAGDRGSFYLRASDQKSSGAVVKVDEVVLSQPGWLVIHEEAKGTPFNRAPIGGHPGNILGTSALLGPGAHRGVEVTLQRPLPGTAIVYPMVHLEDNATTTYDYPTADGPAMVAGADVIVSIEVDVAGGQPG